jgi:NADPH-dependent 2,4-dienoyl-CoA reductase/sulfur reductase-like enzyme
MRGPRGSGDGINNLTVVTGSFPSDDEDEVLCSFATSDVGRINTSTSSSQRVTRVIVGAGVAGTCCAEELCRLRPDDNVVLVTIGNVVKSVTHVEKVTRHVETFDVIERPASCLNHQNLTIVNAAVVGVDHLKKVLFLQNEVDASEGSVLSNDSAIRNVSIPLSRIMYDQLCVCSGAAPKPVFAEEKPKPSTSKSKNKNKPKPSSFADSITVTVRDVESVEALRERLSNARRALLVGNGGIAMELADALCRNNESGEGSTGGKKNNAKNNETKTRELIWTAKHPTIGDAFFDRDAAGFLQKLAERSGCMDEVKGEATEEETVTESDKISHKRRRIERDSSCTGNAAGPDWTSRLGKAGVSGSNQRFKLRILNDVEVVGVEPCVRNDGSNGDWPAVAVLSDGARIECDVIVSATGVDPKPRIDWLPEEYFPRGKDGGIKVTETFQSIGNEHVFCAGDAASCDTRSNDRTTFWFQMRLWSQAKISGTYVARVMAGESDADAFGFNFELFTHTTRFFGKKVILLGLYNGQKSESEKESELVSYARAIYDDEKNENDEKNTNSNSVFQTGQPDRDASTFVRILLRRGKMIGAVLLGDTDLEETFENLILDEIDVSRFGASLLDPEIDIEDYFD